MQNTTVERSIWIAAPRQRVWDAVTEPDQVAQWFLSPQLGAQMKRDEAGKVYVCFGPMEIGVAVFDVMEPPRRATSRSLPEKQLSTHYALEEENGGTRVTITMTGFELPPTGAVEERLAPTGASWEKALANLKAFVEGKEIPHTQGFLAALFGYRREAAKKLSVERSIFIAAPRQRVWDAITDPEQIASWFSPGTQWRATGSHVGAKLSVVDPETGADTNIQTIEVVDPPHRFATRTTPPEDIMLTLWTLTEEKGGTRLTLTYSGYEDMAAEVRPDTMEQNAFGFGMMLDNLKAIVEHGELPMPGGF
jgi:uncharacterized protein YndB with AHSA1/START domain